MFFVFRFVPIDLLQQGQGDVVGDDGVELGDAGVGQVALVGQDHVVGAHADPALFLFGRELLLGQLPGRRVGQDPLVVRLDRTDGVLDLEVDVRFLALELEHGLSQVEPGLGQAAREKKLDRGRLMVRPRFQFGYLNLAVCDNAPPMSPGTV